MPKPRVLLLINQPVLPPDHPDRLSEIGWTSQMGIADARDWLYYLRPTDDGRIVIGGGAGSAVFGGRGDGPTAQRLGWILAPLDRQLPQLSDGALSYRIAVGTVGTGMPGFAGTLAERDRWDLVNYLRDRFDDSAP